MKLGCPVCNSKFTLSQAVHEAGMKEMVELAARFGKSWNLVYNYTECFRSSQWGAVGEAKRLRILRDVEKLFDKAEFDYDGKLYRTNWLAVIAAIRAVVDAEKYGFKNHNYLKKVLLGGPIDGAQGGKPERVSAEGLTAKEEAEREKKRSERSTSNAQHPSMNDKEPTSTMVQWKTKQGIVESLADMVGKRV